MIRRPPRSTPLYSSAASDVYKRQLVKGIVERVQFLRAKMALGAEAVEELAGIEELSVLLAAREFLEREFKCRCEIYDADAVDESVDPKKRRKNAIPLRPAIFVL